MAVAADFSGWVNELDAFNSGSNLAINQEDVPEVDEETNPNMIPRRAVNRPQSSSQRSNNKSQIDELKEEMKLLNWHKLANEAALKAALIKTKQMKKEDIRIRTSLHMEDPNERAEWMKQIIEEEQQKPLEVDSEFIREYETKERVEEERLDNEVQRHISSLRKLKITLAEREDMQQRRMKFREGKLALQKIEIKPKSKLAPKSKNQEEDFLSTSKLDEDIQEMSKKNIEGSNTGHVITSLDKLVELERRISCLESTSAQSSSKNRDSTDLPKKSSLKFRKRINQSSAKKPSTTSFTVSVGRKLNNKPVNGGRDRLVGTRTQRTMNQTSKPTFLTSVPSKSTSMNNAKYLRRLSERDRRRVVKNEKVKLQAVQSKRQDKVIHGWLQKKKQISESNKTRSSTIRKSNAVVNKTRTGASCGRRTNNQYMQKFQNMKNGFENKKRELKSNATRKGQTVSTGSRSRAWGSNNLSNRSSGIINRKPKHPATTTRLLPMVQNRNNHYAVRNSRVTTRTTTSKFKPRITETTKTTLPTIHAGGGISGMGITGSRFR